MLIALKYLSPDAPARSEPEIALDALSSSKRRPLAPVIGRLRAIKSPAEQAVMRAAADISSYAHMKVCPEVSVPLVVELNFLGTL